MRPVRLPNPDEAAETDQQGCEHAPSASIRPAFLWSFDRHYTVDLDLQSCLTLHSALQGQGKTLPFAVSVTIKNIDSARFCSLSTDNSFMYTVDALLISSLYSTCTGCNIGLHISMSHQETIRSVDERCTET